MDSPASPTEASDAVWAALREVSADLRETGRIYREIAKWQRESRRLAEERAAKDEQRWAKDEQRWAKDEQRWAEDKQRWAKDEQRWAKDKQRWVEDEQRWVEDKRRWAKAERELEEMRRRGKEHDRRLRDLDKLFNGQWGKLIESLVDGDLVPLLGRRGIKVNHTSTNAKLEFEGYRREVDILAVNGTEVVAVEVKTTLKVADVDYFLEMLPHFRDLAQEYRNHTVYGAVAYLKADQSSDVYAEKQGLFVIRATGSSASITNGEHFVPRAFG